MKKTAAILILLIFCSALSAQTREQARKARLEKEIEQLEKQLKKNSSKQTDALNTLNLLQKKTASRRKLISQSSWEIRCLDDSIYACQKQINLLNARLDTMSLYYSKLVKNAYKNRDARIWYMYILSSCNIGQAARRYGYLRSLSTQMNAQAVKIQDTRKELGVQVSRMKGLRDEAKKLKSNRERELKTLKAEEAQNQKLIATLKKDKSKYTKQLSTKRTQVQALDKQIKKLISESRKAPSKPTDSKLAAQFEANRGKLPWPVEGPVVGRFGQHNHPVYKNVKLPFNNGINIAVDKGTAVKAVFDGEVRSSIVMPGYGKCVLVQHGEYFTFYCKLGSVSVKSGQKIKTGQTVGTVDTIDGVSQLHFELWKGSSVKDPEDWLK